jgi:hypothetical protein
VIASWLLDLSATALINDPALSGFAGLVSDSGEGRWTIKAAIDEAIPAHILSSAPLNASARAATRISPTSCSPRCATSSAGILSNRPGRNRSRNGISDGSQVT